MEAKLTLLPDSILDHVAQPVMQAMDGSAVITDTHSLAKSFDFIES